jgi:hypothetical protein
VTEQQPAAEAARDAAEAAELRRRTATFARVILVLVTCTLAVSLVTALVAEPGARWSWSAVSTVILNAVLAWLAISLLRSVRR